MTILKKIPFVLFICASFIYSCENAENHDDSKDVAEDQNDEKFESRDAEKDAQFVVDAVSGNYYEIKLASYGAQHSNNAEVKSIATQMVDAHSKMLQELKTLASSKSISVPSEDSTEARKAIDELNDKTPENFDKEWTNKMIDKHKGSIDKLEKAQNEAVDPDIKTWATNTLPAVRGHLDMLNQLDSQLKDKH